MNVEFAKNFNYNHLFYFHVTASQGSIKKASDFLGITQPTISEQIQKLEQTLAIELFSRQNRSIQLSPAGEKVYGYTSKIFGLSEEMILGFHYQNYSNKQKQLRIGVSESIPKNLVTHLFSPLFNGLDFSVYFSSSPSTRLHEKLIAREIDFFVGESVENENNQNIESTLIYEPKIAVVTGKDVESLTLKNYKTKLNDIPYFKFPADNSIQRLIDRFFLQEEIAPFVLGESDDVDMICSFVVANKSFAAIPYEASQKYEDLKAHFILGVEPPEIFGHILKEPENNFAREILKRLLKK